MAFREFGVADLAVGAVPTEDVVAAVGDDADLGEGFAGGTAVPCGGGRGGTVVAAQEAHRQDQGEGGEPAHEEWFNAAAGWVQWCARGVALRLRAALRAVLAQGERGLRDADDLEGFAD